MNNEPSDQDLFDNLMEKWVEQRKYIERLDAKCAKLIEALKEIRKGEGRFSTDNLVHASNTIEDMIGLATKALEEYAK